jgi:hypothetical protein
VGRVFGDRRSHDITAGRLALDCHLEALHRHITGVKDAFVLDGRSVKIAPDETTADKGNYPAPPKPVVRDFVDDGLRRVFHDQIFNGDGIGFHFQANSAIADGHPRQRLPPHPATADADLKAFHDGVLDDVRSVQLHVGVDADFAPPFHPHIFQDACVGGDVANAVRFGVVADINGQVANRPHEPIR